VVVTSLLTTTAEVPVDLSREEARDAARRELADPAYSRDDPNLVERLLIWVDGELRELLARAADATPGGWQGLLVLAVLIVVIVAVVRYRLGPVARRAARARDDLFGAAELTAEDHRRAADRAAARQDWADAVRERLRAIIRDLEERDLLDPRPGRTADEAARDAGGVLPELRQDMLRAAAVFDDVWYGGRPATPAMHEALRDLDSRVARSRPAGIAEATS
jgi:Domain of unknown function (DUF4129)